LNGQQQRGQHVHIGSAPLGEQGLENRFVKCGDWKIERV
jgi:hypothetical protein